jgi:inosine-uridine nucleoside N-ribohydrolase
VIRELTIAIAIVAALYADEADLIGVTTVNGNAALKYTSRNIAKLDPLHLVQQYPDLKRCIQPSVPHSIEYSDDITWFDDTLIV